MFVHLKSSQVPDLSPKFVGLRILCRTIALLLTLVMTGEVIPAPVYASTLSSANNFLSAKSATAKQQIHSYEVMQHLRAEMGAAAPANFAKMAEPMNLPLKISIIDEVGRLTRPIAESDRVTWIQQLHRAPAFATMTARQIDYYAQRHLWLGQYELAVDKQPRLAVQQFRLANHMTNGRDPICGTSIYDEALCDYYQHDFQQSVDFYRHVLRIRPIPNGFDRSDASLMLRHAMACLGYHEGNSKLGIPEPPILDPFCGAAALAASLKSLGLPYSRTIVVANCRVTGEGSDLQDLTDAGSRLGASVYPVSADDKGLMLLPKPAIAFVEQDHFVSVVRADKTGVSYLCSDCGMWPGGQVNLTWKQWHDLSPGIYDAVVSRGGRWDRFFSDLSRLKGRTVSSPSELATIQNDCTSGSKICSLFPNDDLKIASITSQMLPVAALLTHLAILIQDSRFICCGGSAGSTHCCPTCPECPTVGGGPLGGNKPGHTEEIAGPDGPSYGDPVNLATGEEEYTPQDDLNVYNPIGPSVSWGRIYNSLRAPDYELWYEFQDFGQGWSQNYNIGINDPTDGGSGPSNFKYIYWPNGGRMEFTAPAVPTEENPIVNCQLQAGYPYLVTWNYSESTGTTYYVITDGDRNKYVTSPVSTATLCSVLVEIIDRNGNSINFNYSAPVNQYTIGASGPWPLLTSITDSANSPLLVINRVQDGTGSIASVDDRYGRTVYYHVGYYQNMNVGPYQQYEYICDHVSQIVPTDTSNPPDRYHYGYSLTTNENASELVPELTSISVPNPSGSAEPATATISYNSADVSVASLVDSNGNEIDTASVGAGGSSELGTNYTEAIIKASDAYGLYSTTVSFNSNMQPLTKTDGVGNLTATYIYGDGNNPYSPTSMTDANGKVWTYSYTPNGYGNLQTSVSPRGTTTTNAWNFSNFALGEEVQQQESFTSGGVTIVKAPTLYSYYEPSGLTEMVVEPTPGTVGSSSEVTYRNTYDDLGDLTQMTTPGNNAASSITDTLYYGSSPQIGQILTATDNLGHSTNFTYDSQANLTSRTDALGNTTYWGTTAGIGGYNIANQNVLVTYPATGDSGTGSSTDTTTYEYPGGPATVESAYDEGGTLYRQTTTSYGEEDETLNVVGATEPVTYTYDALYRLSSLSDGNSHTTNYYYNRQGYLDSITYPGYSGPTPALNTSTGTWSNVTGADSLRDASYDPAGNVLTRVDGRGVVTTYTYADPESQLTNVSYNTSGTSVSAQPNVALAYDGFGRLASVDNGVTKENYGYASGGTNYPGYDDNDNLLNAQTGYYNSAGGSILFTAALGYGYYPNGSKSTSVVPSGTFTYNYDGAGRPVSETNPFSETTSWSYQNNNWLSGQTLGNGATTSYSYNLRGFETSLANHDGSGNILSNFNGMTYDAAGNRTASTTAETSDTAYSGATAYTYDYRNELTNEASTRNGGYTNAFAYDAAENPTEFRSVSGNTFNSDNQRSNTGYAYDGNGNPTTYSSKSLSFDVENRLTAVDSTLAAGYDGFGLRAWKTDSTGTTYYLYDHDTTSPVCELTSTGAVTATNTYTANGLVSRRTSTGSTFYEFDPQGSITARLNSAGSCTCSSITDGFGKVANSATVSDPFGYEAQAGYVTDPATGLILTTFRYYDPSSGRFLNRDPIGYGGGIGLYDYVDNDAENEDDTTGLQGLNGGPVLPPKTIVPKRGGVTVVHFYRSGDHDPAHVHVRDTNNPRDGRGARVDRNGNPLTDNDSLSERTQKVVKGCIDDIRKACDDIDDWCRANIPDWKGSPGRPSRGAPVDHPPLFDPPAGEPPVYEPPVYEPPVYEPTGPGQPEPEPEPGSSDD